MAEIHKRLHGDSAAPRGVAYRRERLAGRHRLPIHFCVVSIECGRFPLNWRELVRQYIRRILWRLDLGFQYRIYSSSCPMQSSSWPSLTPITAWIQFLAFYHSSKLLFWEYFPCQILSFAYKFILRSEVFDIIEDFLNCYLFSFNLMKIAASSFFVVGELHKS